MLGDLTQKVGVLSEARTVRRTSVAIVCFRVALGIVMLRMAYVLAFKGGWDAFGNVGGIIPSVVQGPFSDFLMSLYGNQIALWLMILGSGAVGVSLVTGLLVRLGAICGSIMAISFYLGALPPPDGWINTNVLFILGFVIVAISGSGYHLGVDKLLRQMEERYPLLRYLTG